MPYFRTGNRCRSGSQRRPLCCLGQGRAVLTRVARFCMSEFDAALKHDCLKRVWRHPDIVAIDKGRIDALSPDIRCLAVDDPNIGIGFAQNGIAFLSGLQEESSVAGRQGHREAVKCRQSRPNAMWSRKKPVFNPAHPPWPTPLLETIELFRSRKKVRKLNSNFVSSSACRRFSRRNSRKSRLIHFRVASSTEDSAAPGGGGASG